MVKMTGIYQGEKHCDLVHLQSQAKISTDAPKDNNGKGESFSPTDLLAVSLGACMLTVMAINAEKENYSLLGSDFEVEKHMQNSPRKVSMIKLKMNIRSNLPIERRAWLENIAQTCPVRLSLNPDIQVSIDFHYGSSSTSS